MTCFQKKGKVFRSGNALKGCDWQKGRPDLHRETKRRREELEKWAQDLQRLFPGVRGLEKSPG